MGAGLHLHAVAAQLGLQFVPTADVGRGMLQGVGYLVARALPIRVPLGLRGLGRGLAVSRLDLAGLLTAPLLGYGEAQLLL